MTTTRRTSPGPHPRRQNSGRLGGPFGPLLTGRSWLLLGCAAAVAAIPGGLLAAGLRALCCCLVGWSGAAAAAGWWGGRRPRGGSSPALLGALSGPLSVLPHGLCRLSPAAAAAAARDCPRLCLPTAWGPSDRPGAIVTNLLLPEPRNLRPPELLLPHSCQVWDCCALLAAAGGLFLLLLLRPLGSVSPWPRRCHHGVRGHHCRTGSLCPCWQLLEYIIGLCCLQLAQPQELPYATTGLTPPGFGQNYFLPYQSCLVKLDNQTTHNRNIREGGGGG